MYLSRLEEKMFNGEFGETLEKSIKILTAVGDIYNAKNLIPIKHTQISGISYKTIGDPGIKWISNMKGTVKVPSYLNPCGIDLKNPYFLNTDIHFIKKQMEIINLFKNVGASITCTCTPYYLTSLNLKVGDQLSWSESSAVIYVNSIYGCRTNREGGPSALAAAFVGKTPNCGLHISENRDPKIRFIIDEKLTPFSDIDYNILGLIIGKLCKTNIPLILLKEIPSLDDLKKFGASMAASGCVPLYHIPKITAESRNINLKSTFYETVEIQKKELYDYKEKLIYDKINFMKIDLVILGCPHCSKEEIYFISKYLNKKKVKIDLFIFVSRFIYRTCFKEIKNIISSNAKVVCDTCVIVSNICKTYDSILVNSGKTYMYLPTMCFKKVYLGSTIDCLLVALGN